LINLNEISLASAESTAAYDAWKLEHDAYFGFFAARSTFPLDMRPRYSVEEAVEILQKQNQTAFIAKYNLPDKSQARDELNTVLFYTAAIVDQNLLDCKVAATESKHDLSVQQATFEEHHNALVAAQDGVTATTAKITMSDARMLKMQEESASVDRNFAENQKTLQDELHEKKKDLEILKKLRKMTKCEGDMTVPNPVAPNSTVNTTFAQFRRCHGDCHRGAEFEDNEALREASEGASESTRALMERIFDFGREQMEESLRSEHHDKTIVRDAQPVDLGGKDFVPPTPHVREAKPVSFLAMELGNL